MIGFGNYTKKAEATTITSLTDNRLVKIDPQEPGFFDEVLNFKSTNEDINTFIEAVAEVKGTSLEAFYRVMYDPTEAGDHMVVFQKGKRPAVGHSYNWWVETASKMSPVEGRQWHIATEYQYYAFLVWLINQLVKIGKSVEEALHQVVLDSKELGHYYDSENSTKGEDFEFTGSRCVCGLYDLANTFKILQYTQIRKLVAFGLLGAITVIMVTAIRLPSLAMTLIWILTAIIVWVCLCFK